MTVGERLKVALCDKYMTQKQLAEKLHVSESTVQKWCTDKNAIPADKLVDVSCALGISVLSLLGLDVQSNDYENVDLEQLTISDEVYEDLPLCQKRYMESAKRYVALERYRLHGYLSQEEENAVTMEQSLIVRSGIDTNLCDVIEYFINVDLAQRYLMLERYTQAEDITTEDLVQLKAEMNDLLADDENGSLQHMIDKFHRLDRQGCLFKRVFMKMNKYEYAFSILASELLGNFGRLPSGRRLLEEQGM